MSRLILTLTAEYIQNFITTESVINSGLSSETEPFLVTVVESDDSEDLVKTFIHADGDVRVVRDKHDPIIVRREESKTLNEFISNIVESYMRQEYVNDLDTLLDVFILERRV